MARELNAVVRETKGRHAASRLRQESRIPAVIYREGKIGTNLSIARNEWMKLMSSGERVVTLKMAGGDKQALIKAVQYDSMGDNILHVDFNELREGQKVRIAVALVIKGVPKGHADGGVLNQPVHTIHIECLPTQIPEKIVVDVEAMGIDDMIHIRELKLPEGVTAVDAPDIVVVAVHEPKAEVAAAPAEGAAEPVVLTAKKEEGAEGAPAAAKPGEKKDDKKK